MATAGNRKAIGLRLRHLKNAGKVADAAKPGPAFINAAALPPRVVVAAPAIGSHHREVKLLLLGVQGLQGFWPFARIKPAAGATAVDALPGKPLGGLLLGRVIGLHPWVKRA